MGVSSDKEEINEVEMNWPVGSDKIETILGATFLKCGTFKFHKIVDH